MVKLDLDLFKQFNENGFDYGDSLLVKTAQLLRALTRENELCSRFDSDAFSLLLESDKGCPGFEERVRTIKAALVRETRHGVYITPSIGAACVTGRRAGFNELFEKADEAIREAKRRGGNRYVFYSPEINRTGRETAFLVRAAGCAGKHKIEIRTFGYFDVFVDGRAVTFSAKNRKSSCAFHRPGEAAP